MKDEPEYVVTSHERLPAALERAIDQGLEDANHSAAPLDEVHPLACLAQDARGELLGGALGRTWGQCCELQQLWVTPESRRRGIGRKLVQAFHRQAEARGCSNFYLETFSFQVPELYRELGYGVKLELSGFSPGVRKYIMVRS